MHALKPILRNLTVLNGILFTAVAIWVFLIVLPFVNMRINVTAVRPVQTVQGNRTSATESLNLSPVDYTMVSEQNLFHPERKIPPEKAEEKAVPRPEVVLYGTLLMNDVSIAYIEDKKSPRTSPGRGKRQIAAEKGYNLNGYILREIKPDSIVFVKGDDRLIVRLEDGEKRRDVEIAKTPMSAGAAPAGPQHSKTAVPASQTVQQPEIAAPGAAPGMGGRRNAAQLQALKRRQGTQIQQQTQ